MKRNKKLWPLTVSGLIFLAACFVACLSDEKLKGDSPTNLIDRIIPKASVQSHTSLRDSIVDFGMELVGTPYVSGGRTTDGFDCSGFVYFVYQHFNINVPRSSVEFEHFGTEIPVENVEKGDLLLFLSPTRDVIGHMGIVSNPKGKESDFIHSTSGKQMKVVITSLTNEGYTRRFVKAIRIL